MCMDMGRETVAGMGIRWADSRRCPSLVGDMDTAEQVQKHDSNSFHGEAEGRSYFCRRKIGYKH